MCYKILADHKPLGGCADFGPWNCIEVRLDAKVSKDWVRHSLYKRHPASLWEKPPVKRMCKYYFIQVLFFQVKFYFYWQSVHYNLLPLQIKCAWPFIISYRCPSLKAAPSSICPRLQIKFAVDVVVVKGEKSVAASKRGNAKRQGLDYRPASTTLQIL